MKQAILIILMIFITACKVETQKSVPVINELNDDQIAVSSTEPTSEEMDQFIEDIENRQKAEPDKMFEVVKRKTFDSNSPVISSAMSDDSLYPNKNFYIFIALGQRDKDYRIQKADWEAIYHIMNYMAERKYRVLMNVNATKEHLKIAAEDDKTAVILWSSHGNAGKFYDFNGDAVPFDIFKNKNKNFYQFILSSCFGRIALDKNYYTKGLNTLAWPGLTTSAILKDYLMSDAWSSENGKVLTPVTHGLTCTSDGKLFRIIKDEIKTNLYGDSFGSLVICQSQLKMIKNNKICMTSNKIIKQVNIDDLSVSVESFTSLNACQSK